MYYDLADDTIIQLMNDYLLSDKDYRRRFYYFNQFLFKRKLSAMSDRNCSIEYHIRYLPKYNKLRTIKNFVKYGLCVKCNRLNDEVKEFTHVENINLNELESKYIHICDTCSGSPPDMWLDDVCLLEHIGLDNVAFKMSEYCNIRTAWCDREKKIIYFAEDANHYIRRGNLKKIQDEKEYERRKRSEIIYKLKK